MLLVGVSRARGRLAEHPVCDCLQKDLAPRRVVYGLYKLSGSCQELATEEVAVRPTTLRRTLLGALPPRR